MARRFNILRPQSRDDRLKTLMHRMKLAAARAALIATTPATA
ncbi:MAG: hypothetical protein Q8L23_13270 [Caulobacter sp.]|nr:hypothetical protein [Caulobacter sp.]